MMFDVFGAKKKVVIGMAHIGALPGAPAYDAAGGVAKLIDDVRRRRAQAASRRRSTRSCSATRIDRPYQLTAPPEGVAAMTAVVQALKPELKVPFGVNYLWDPVASVAIAVRDRRALRARDIHRRVRLRHGAVGARMRAARAAARATRAARSEAAVQHQCGIRLFARSAADRAAGAQRGVFLARRRHSRVRAADGQVGRPVRLAEGARRRRRTCRCSPTPASRSTMSRDILRVADGVHHRHASEGRRRHLEPGRRRAGASASWRS